MLRSLIDALIVAAIQKLMISILLGGSRPIQGLGSVTLSIFYFKLVNQAVHPISCRLSISKLLKLKLCLELLSVLVLHQMRLVHRGFKHDISFRR